MLKGVYKREKIEKSVEEQIINIIKNDDRDNMYDLKLRIITNIPIDDEHVYDIPVLIYRHPHDYYYIYMCKGINMEDVELIHNPCGLIKAEPYKRGGPMFSKEWILEMYNKKLAEVK